jgi:tetratricopeptide (TPR) repeat protein
MRTVLALALLASTAGPTSAGLPGVGQTPPAPTTATPPPPAEDNANGISLTAADAGEPWTLAVIPLAPKDGQPASHAFVFVGILKGCTTPRSFPIVFVIDGDRTVSKQGALLSRQQADGGCVDGLATVFPEGTADALGGATRVAVTLPQATFELTARHLDYLRQRLTLRESAPVGGDTATAKSAPTPLPTDPAARAAADEATSLNERAIELIGAGRLRDARQAAEAAVAAEERAYGPDHAKVGEVVMNLGMIERRLGNTKVAVSHYERAIRLLEPQGPSQALGIVLDNLGRILHEQKKIDEAFAVTSRAVEVLTAVLGPADLHVGYALNNLALLWDAKGEKVKAAETCDRALDILVQALGPDDPRLARFLEDQRTLRRKAGRK